MDGGECAVGGRRGDCGGEGEPTDHGICRGLHREEDGTGPGQQEHGDDSHHDSAGHQRHDGQVGAAQRGPQGSAAILRVAHEEERGESPDRQQGRSDVDARSLEQTDGREPREHPDEQPDRGEEARPQQLLEPAPGAVAEHILQAATLGPRPTSLGAGEQQHRQHDRDRLTGADGAEEHRKG